VNTISEERARDLLRYQLVGPVECDQLALDCALLRSCLWALSGGTTPVHVLRLLNLATSLEASNAEVRPKIKETLEELAEAGDLVELANGRWLPAPTREVPLETGDDARLLVGGVPTSLLPPEIRSKLENNGVFRRMRGDFITRELGLTSEKRKSWMGEAPEHLEAWTKAAFQGHYEAAREEGRYFFFYAPELFPASTPQALRWTDRQDRLSGAYLCRHDLPFGLRRHYAGQIVGGKLARIRLMQVSDLRRLLYGLDLLSGKPVGVEEATRGAEYSVVLKSELPKAERRLFGALGRVIFSEENYYPRTWHFPVRYALEVRGRLSALGIRVFSRTGT
jgi:hypothetical protein